MQIHSFIRALPLVLLILVALSPAAIFAKDGDAVKDVSVLLFSSQKDPEGATDSSTFLAPLITAGAINVTQGTGEADDRSKKITIDGAKVRKELSQEGIGKVTVRGRDSKKKESVQNGADLAVIGIAEAENDANIKSITITYDDVIVEYVAEGKLLWFFSHAYTETVTANLHPEVETKRVFVKLPWYRYFLKPSIPPANVELKIEGDTTDAINLNSEKDIPLPFQQSSILLTMTSVLKLKEVVPDLPPADG